MKADEIRERLRKCNDLMDLVGEATALKKAGENEKLVNRIMTEVRAELTQKGAQIKQFPRKAVNVETSTKAGYIMVIPEDLTSPTVVVCADGSFII